MTVRTEHVLQVVSRRIVFCRILFSRLWDWQTGMVSFCRNCGRNMQVYLNSTSAVLVLEAEAFTALFV